MLFLNEVSLSIFLGETVLYQTLHQKRYQCPKQNFRLDVEDF